MTDEKRSENRPSDSGENHPFASGENYSLDLGDHEEMLRNLRSIDSEKRRMAIRDLAVSTYENKIQMLERLLCEERDIQLKYEIRKTLSELRSLSIKPPQVTDSENIKNLQKAFQSSNSEVVNRAFLYALKHRVEECLPEMLMIETYSGEVWHKICNIRLMQVSGGRHFQHILSYLSDREPRVISTAIEALENIGNTMALASITQFTTHAHNRVRATAIKALQNLGDEKAYMLFSKMIQSPYSAYRDSAAYALSQLDTPQGARFLAILLLDEVESVRVKALQGLEKMAEKGFELAIRIIERLKFESPYGLWPDKVIDKLKPGAVSDLTVTEENTSNLAGSKQILEEAVVVNAALHSDVSEFRIAAIEKLCQENEAETDQMIMERLKLEKDSKVIASAITALGRNNTETDKKRFVLEKYLDHHNPRVRANTIEALCAITEENERAFLVPLLSDTSNRVAGNAIVGLYSVFHNRAMKALLELVNSKNKLYQLTAVYCIGELADFNLHREAEKLLHSRFSEVREKMENILALLANIPAFEGLLKKHNQEKEKFTG